MGLLLWNCLNLVNAQDTAARPAQPTIGANAPTSVTLACTSTGNCVNSLGTGALAPLLHQGSAKQAHTRLINLLEAMNDVQITHVDELEIRCIFTTLLGFRDEVIFLIDASGERVDFRSRSLVGLYDFGKNSARMKEFARQFEIRPGSH